MKKVEKIRIGRVRGCRWSESPYLDEGALTSSWLTVTTTSSSAPVDAGYLGRRLEEEADRGYENGSSRDFALSTRRT
jgi:hypothetical protein